MKAEVEIEAGICGFHTSARVQSRDHQHVDLALETDCEKIQKLSLLLEKEGALDAYREIDPKGESVILRHGRDTCCPGCAVPIGLFKAVQVAAGLALPRDVSIKIGKE
ncbi:MAG: hypothetical protein JRH07_16815 [Deltaproteobacteria bacterium]|nr:hypothetical protein [Deltaproteobacteria bacterium]MBW2123483.1 hypothetical protein [Deltaproteobacteria bacterium]